MTLDMLLRVMACLALIGAAGTFAAHLVMNSRSVWPLVAFAILGFPLLFAAIAFIGGVVAL